MRLREIATAYVRRFTSGHYNYHYNLTIRYRGKRIELEHGSGTDDDDTVYRDGTCVYVLSTNRGLGSVALSRFDLAAEPESANDSDDASATVLRPAWEIYHQNAHEALESDLPAGKAWDDYSERYLARILMQWDNG